ncbi:copper amine oxidase N-terminal domain-containing protein [Paenibacillus peoriae]|uniref:copper amine oxidase N-terminal domain-containing protein n=1 Tax=Paenibacillus peoriae TaxID=59893 RepID=UPI00026C5656|nr:copper amine oxidase N-terminal domain-containing protein [Paenibacillus peoriae]MEC0181730.1 copper amine oxidase N-terminal domain-containing protein [Paenibacillus peoriae]
MKRNLIILFLMLLIAAVFSGAIYAEDVSKPKVYVNNERLDSETFIAYSGVTMVPFRDIFARYDMEVKWDNVQKIVLASSKDGSIVIKLAQDSNDGYVNNKKYNLTQSPALVNGVLYVNLRFISESIGAKVNYDKPSLSIHITLPKVETE